jgi:DNA-binding FadR family transcriptional regulator
MTDDSTTLPDLVVDHFVAQIVTGALAPGERLPPYRELAASLGVDQTTLRSALRILGRMDLVRSIQGSGTTVNDYRRHARLDLLDAVFRIEQLELGQRLLMPALAMFIRVVPRIVRDGMETLAPEAMAEVSRSYGSILHAVKTGSGAARIAQLDGEVLEAVAAGLEDPFLQLAVNSSRRLRRSLTTRLLEAVDARAHYATILELVRRHQAGTLAAAELETALRDYMTQATAPLRAYFAQLPAEPYLVAPILLARRRLAESARR